MRNTNDTRKWYLRSNFVYILAIVVPLIGYIHIFLHRKQWEYDEKLSYLMVATITTSLWTVKFLPGELKIVGVVLVAISCLCF